MGKKNFSSFTEQTTIYNKKKIVEIIFKIFVFSFLFKKKIIKKLPANPIAFYIRGPLFSHHPLYTYRWILFFQYVTVKI